MTSAVHGRTNQVSALGTNNLKGPHFVMGQRVFVVAALKANILQFYTFCHKAERKHCSAFMKKKTIHFLSIKITSN